MRIIYDYISYGLNQHFIKVILLPTVRTIFFWVLNYLYVTSGNLGWNGFDNASGTLSMSYTYGMFFNAALFYLQVFWLVPKYYVKNNKAQFWVLTIGIWLILSIIETYLDLKVAERYEVYKGSEYPLIVFSIPWMYHNSIFHALYVLTGFFIIKECFKIRYFTFE